MDNIKLTGKFLIRNTTKKNGEPVILLAGTFIPDNPELYDALGETDEMWVTSINISNRGLRFKEPIGENRMGVSPEDFLYAGVGCFPCHYEIKETLKNM